MLAAQDGSGRSSCHSHHWILLKAHCLGRSAAPLQHGDPRPWPRLQLFWSNGCQGVGTQLHVGPGFRV